MSDSLRRAALPVVLLSLLAALLLWSGRLSSEAAPAAPAATAAATVPPAEIVGRLTIPGLPGVPSNFTWNTTIRSFSVSASNTGGGITVGVPVAGIDSSSYTPMLLRAAATGIHLPSANVVLYYPETRTRMEQWTFTEVQLTEVKDSQSGPPSRTPRLTLSWDFTRITYATYDTNGSTLRSTYCYDTSTHGTCA